MDRPEKNDYYSREKKLIVFHERKNGPDSCGHKSQRERERERERESLDSMERVIKSSASPWRWSYSVVIISTPHLSSFLSGRGMHDLQVRVNKREENTSICNYSVVSSLTAFQIQISGRNTIKNKDLGKKVSSSLSFSLSLDYLPRSIRDLFVMSRFLRDCVGHHVVLIILQVFQVLEANASVICIRYLLPPLSAFAVSPWQEMRHTGNGRSLNCIQYHHLSLTSSLWLQDPNREIECQTRDHNSLRLKESRCPP